MPDGPESDEDIVRPWADDSLSPSHLPVAGRGLLDRPSILRKSTIKAIRNMGLGALETAQAVDVMKGNGVRTIDRTYLEAFTSAPC